MLVKLTSSVIEKTIFPETFSHTIFWVNGWFPTTISCEIVERASNDFHEYFLKDIRNMLHHIIVFS